MGFSFLTNLLHATGYNNLLNLLIWFIMYRVLVLILSLVPEFLSSFPRIVTSAYSVFACSLFFLIEMAIAKDMITRGAYANTKEST